MRNLAVDQALSKAKSHAKKGRIKQAQELYLAVLKAFPENKRAQKGLAILGGLMTSGVKQNPPQHIITRISELFNNGKLMEVIEQTQTILKQYPNSFILWNIVGAANNGLQMLSAASEAFKKVTELNPSYPDGFNNLGVSLQKQGNFDEAVTWFKKAVSLRPDYFEAYFNMGNALQGLEKFDEALTCYEKALTLRPEHVEAYFNMGNALQEKAEFDQAVTCYKKALTLRPDYADAYYNLAFAFQEQAKFDEAITFYKRMLELRPDYVDALLNMGNAFQEQAKFDEAISSYSKVLCLKPNYADAHLNMGNALQGQAKFDEAVSYYNKALSLRPDDEKSFYNLGNALREQGKLDKAISAFEKALSLRPHYEAARLQKLHLQAQTCDWLAIEEDKKYVAELGIKGKAVSPFGMLSLDDAPERHILRAINYSKFSFPHKQLSLPKSTSEKPQRLRIGYFSADFYNHATMFLMAQIFQLHDKTQFDVFAYSYGPQTMDDMRSNIASSVHSFRDVSKLNDIQIVQLVRNDNLHIAIDLKGFTARSRLSPFAYRLAPVQISFLGYPGTLGTEFIDYIVADSIVIPEENRKYYSEQIIYLPNSYQPNDDSRIISQGKFTRRSTGLPNDSFVFCCFNNCYKISPSEFDIWMRLLSRVSGSVLWLMKTNEWAEQNLMKEAQARGIDPSRLVFAEKMPQAYHLARQKLADLFLDTFNVNAHTTASDALWAGLPIITKLGRGFAARVSGSLLAAVGLPELVTENESSYEALALELATNETKLLKLRKKLQDNLVSEPLFDAKRFTVHLESGYQQAYARYFEGKKPSTIFVPR